MMNVLQFTLPKAYIIQWKWAIKNWLKRHFYKVTKLENLGGNSRLLTKMIYPQKKLHYQGIK